MPPSNMKCAALVLALALPACSPADEPHIDKDTASRPNLLLISVDSLRADHTTPYGYSPKYQPTAQTTPALQKLADEGILFEQASSTTSWTLPAHMALMTGLPGALHQVTDNRRRLDPAITTLAEALQAQGFRTAGFFSGPNLHPAFGFGAGFETYQNCSGKELPEGAFEAALTGGDNKDLVNLHKDSHSGLSSKALLDESSTWLEDAAAKDEPFFLFVHWWDPHYDYTPPKALAKSFDPTYQGKQTGVDFLSLARSPEPRDLEHILALYDAEIRYTDNHIGKLLAKLDALDLADDTLVVFTADHGDEFFERGFRGHQRTLYEEAVQVPMVMRLPGVLPAGKRVAGNAGLQDVFSTVADLLDLPLPNYEIGPSLRPLWENGDDGRQHFMELNLAHRNIHITSVRDGDTKVIWDHEQDRLEVFDLASDPLEQNPRVAPGMAGPMEDGGELTAERALIATHLARLEQRRKALPATEGFRADHELSAELLEELARMGYLDSEGADR
jgi:arylsulfatase A-like enzyme